jgi:hypothetical protein
MAILFLVDASLNGSTVRMRWNASGHQASAARTGLDEDTQPKMPPCALIIASGLVGLGEIRAAAVGQDGRH